MKKLRSAIFGAALAALLVLPFVAGRAFGPAAGAQARQAAKAAYGPVPGGEYEFDPSHSVIGFAIRHLEISWVEGRFKDFAGTIRYDDKDVTKSVVEFTAKVASVDTGVEARDKQLRNADFFEVEKYPEMTFKSTRVERRGADGYVLHGNLTLKGVTKPLALPFTFTGAIKDPWGDTRFGIEARTKINRRDFNINYSRLLEGGGLAVGDEVTINLSLEAVHLAPKPAKQ